MNYYDITNKFEMQSMIITCDTKGSHTKVTIRKGKTDSIGVVMVLDDTELETLAAAFQAIAKIRFGDEKYAEMNCLRCGRNAALLDSELCEYCEKEMGYR